MFKFLKGLLDRLYRGRRKVAEKVPVCGEEFLLQVSRGGEPWETIGRDRDKEFLEVLRIRDVQNSGKNLMRAVMNIAALSDRDLSRLDLLDLEYRIIPAGYVEG